MTELHVGKQQGTGTKSLATNLPRGLRFDRPDDIRDRHAAHRIVLHVAAGMKGRLKRHPSNRRMLDCEFDDPADLVVVHAALDRRNDRDAQPDLCKPVERPQLLLQQVRLAADDSIGLQFEAVELKVECRPHLVELLQKMIVPGDSLAVGVEHHEANVAGLCGANEIDDPRMDGRLAAGKLENLGITFGADVIVEQLFHLFERQAESRRRIGEAKRTIHVAGAVDLDDAEAGMLLMVRAQTAIMRTAALDLCAICQGNRAGLVVGRERRVGLGVCVNERRKGSAVGTALAHVDFVVAQENLGVDHPAAVRTDAARKLMKYIIDIFARADRDRALVLAEFKTRHDLHALGRRPAPSINRHLSSHTAHSRTGDKQRRDDAIEAEAAKVSHVAHTKNVRERRQGRQCKQRNPNPSLQPEQAEAARMAT